MTIQESSILEQLQRRAELKAHLKKGWKLIDTVDLVVEMGESLIKSVVCQESTASPLLFRDCEGENLGRHGTITSLSIYVRDANMVFIVDLQVLGDAAFDTPFSDEKTLRATLEDYNIPKCFWDVRQDSNALYKHHKVALNFVIDVQLMENRSRERRDPMMWRRNRLLGYGAAISQDVDLPTYQKELFEEIKALGHNNFESDKSWVSRRPMDEDLELYCALDVNPMAQLFDLYRPNLTDPE